MTPAALLAEARADGVLVEPTLKGTLKVTGPEESIQRWTPTLRHHRLALIDTLWSELAQFRLDLVAADVADAANAAELRRTNNMALHFMMTDEMSFNAAMRAAAEIVVSCPMAECERGYLDVASLWASFEDRNTNASLITADRNFCKPYRSY
jgi:hypothetical protein